MASPPGHEDFDLQLRLAAIEHCRRLRQTWGEAVPAGELTKGFLFKGQSIKLVAWIRGIFKPKQLQDGPLTLVSSLASTYSDEHLDGDTLLYDFARADSDGANRGLQKLGQEGRPVILLKQVKKKPGSEYMIFAPAFVHSTDLIARKFRLSLAESPSAEVSSRSVAFGVVERRYSVSQARARMHQAHFRRNVLGAYRDRCCVCDLRERRLLDAAHITSDSAPTGEPLVTNGLSMCPSHHRAFDRYLFEIDANYRVRVLHSQLDSPQTEATKELLLRFEGREILLPKDRQHYPDPIRLSDRHQLV